MVEIDNLYGCTVNVDSYQQRFKLRGSAITWLMAKLGGITLDKHRWRYGYRIGDGQLVNALH